ncbi:MAG: SRPBCC family protein [Acidimicrobiales bacterium]
MKARWTEREIAAPVEVVWALLVDVNRWPEWGPSVRRAELSTPHLQLGSRGRVTTVLGVTAPFVITRFEPGKSWSWAVAGVRATDHRVDDIGNGRSRAAFGVPLVALPYLAICRVALRRVSALAEGEQV